VWLDQRDGAINPWHTAGMADGVAGAIDQVEHLARVGQTHQQRRVAPDAVVRQRQAALALAERRRDRAVHVHERFREKPAWLPPPDVLARAVERRQQPGDVGLVKTAREVAAGGRVGDAFRAPGVEERRVVAAQFDVFEPLAAEQGVVTELEHMIALVIGQVTLEQPQALINGRDQSQLLHHQMHRAEAAVTGGATFVAEFVMDVAGGKHGEGLRAPLPRLEPALDSLLAFLELAAVKMAHLKCPFVRWFGFVKSRITEEKRAFRVYSAEITLVEGLGHRHVQLPRH